jgi:hypothetical protein
MLYINNYLFMHVYTVWGLLIFYQVVNNITNNYNI